jgi:hypothetical protein
MGDAEPVPIRQTPIFQFSLPPPSIAKPMSHSQPPVQQRRPPPTDLVSMSREDTEMGDAEPVPIRQTPIFQFSLPPPSIAKPMSHSQPPVQQRPPSLNDQATTVDREDTKMGEASPLPILPHRPTCPPPFNPPNIPAPSIVTQCEKPMSQCPISPALFPPILPQQQIAPNIPGIQPLIANPQTPVQQRLCGTRVWCNGLISDESPKRKSFERGKWFDGAFDAHPPHTPPPSRHLLYTEYPHLTPRTPISERRTIGNGQSIDPRRATSAAERRRATSALQPSVVAQPLRCSRARPKIFLRRQTRNPDHTALKTTQLYPQHPVLRDRPCCATVT